MQISFDLTEDVVQELKSISNRDSFVNQVIKKALQKRTQVKKNPSKWAMLAQEIEQENYFSSYSESLKKDMSFVRENFVFLSDKE
jgi:hypothetical protein